MNELFEQLAQRAAQTEDPLKALSGAQGIGPSQLDGVELKVGAMPMPPISRIGGFLSRLFRKPAPAISKQAPTLGEHVAEFAPVGGEAAFNASRVNPSVIEKVYQGILSKGGR